MLQHTNTNILLLLASGGWGNRILPLVSAIRISDLTDRKLIIKWRLNEPWFDIPFDKIWANTDLNINDSYPINDFQYLHSNTTTMVCCIPHGNVAARTYKCLVSTSEYDERQFCHFMYPEWFCQSLRSYYQKLILVKELQNKVNEIISQYDKNTIGVHIRKKWLYGRPTPAPDKWVYEQVEKYDKFFLTSDSRPTENRFKKRYGNRIIIQPKTETPVMWDYKSDSKRLCDHGYCTNKALEEAVVDWTALTKTKAIISPNWSSFSAAAALFGDIAMTLYAIHRESVPHSKFDYALGRDTNNPPNSHL